MVSVMNIHGVALTEADYSRLAESWIDRDLADQALIRRVTGPEAAAIVGRKDNGTMAGIIFPYIWPGDSSVRAYRLRRDHPPLEYGSDGKAREREKYLSAPGQGNRLYIVPGTNPVWLQDQTIPVAITEGEKKAI